MASARDEREAELRRVVWRRLVAFGSGLALLTGVGLLSVAGAQWAESWAWFALLALGGVAMAAWGATWALRPWSKTPAPIAPRALGPHADSTASRPPEATPSEAGQAVPDPVDYLTALRHEFRTPLNAVLGFSDVLLSGIDGEINDSQREDLEIIRASGIRLRILLDGALDFTQLADTDLRLDTERTDIRELVSRVAGEASQLWSSKRTAACVLPDKPCTLEVDDARLRRSILVLADFLATEHRNAAIALSVDPSNDHVAIEVTAEPSDQMTLAALPTPREVLASEDANEIRRWPIAVTSEVIAQHRGSLYHGDRPSRFMIRLPMRGSS